MNDSPLELLPSADLVALAPVVLLALWAMGVLVADLFLPASRRAVLPFVAVAGLVLAFGAVQLTAPSGGEVRLIFHDCLRLDPVVILAHKVILGVTGFLILVSPYYLRDRRIPRGEYYALILFAAVAMMVLAASNELLTLFLNLEFLSFTLYILTGLERDNLRSTEAAFKYFLSGSYAAAFLLFGLTMVYGATGTTFFEEIKASLAGDGSGAIVEHPLFLAGGLAFMFVGFGFKLTLAPFHMYAPDVYAGAPTPVAGLIATGSKVAALVALLGVFRLFVGSEAVPASVGYALAGITVASIAIGNVGAVLQPNIKRLLAYSGVAHSGYAMIPFVAVLSAPELLGEAEQALGYYLVAYALMTVLAFGVASTLGPHGESHLDRYAGLARRSPVLAAVLALALISLTGVPLTVGFMGKVYLFSVAISAELYALAIFGVLASVASAYYYLRIIVKMYMEEPPGGKIEPVALEGANAAALLAASIGVLLFAFYPAFVALN